MSSYIPQFHAAYADAYRLGKLGLAVTLFLIGTRHLASDAKAGWREAHGSGSAALDCCCGIVSFRDCKRFYPSVSIVIAMSSKILDFYRGSCDDMGRTLDEILEWPDVQLGGCPRFHPMALPTAERSGANPDAPILDAATIDAFRQSGELQQRLRQSFFAHAALLWV